VPFTVRVSGAEELEQGPDPAAVALENALRKARAALRPGMGEAVLGCDTIVVLEGAIYGKPADEAAARATMTALAGHTHEVISGVALLLDGVEGVVERTAMARSRVTFRALDEELLDWYVATEEWRGRSGGYAVQGATGERLVLSVEGELENVIGLPLRTVRELGPELFED
jgi:septum formation protein